MESEEEPRLLFSIEGKARKRKLKKLRSFAAVYTDRIEIELDGGRDVFSRDDIIDIYVQEPVIATVDSRTTVIDFYEAGEQNYYELEDSTFPELAHKMEKVVAKEWSFVADKRKYEPMVRWFVACCAIVQIESQQNPFIFGGQYKDPDSIAGTRKTLYQNWGFNNKKDLLKMLPKLLDGRTVTKFRKKAAQAATLEAAEQAVVRFVEDHGGESSLWAWDLQRLILLSSYSYVCDWLSWEDALAWCRQAGEKLQSHYHSWDEFMENYLVGYCYWSGDSLDDENSEAHERQNVYAHYTKLKADPWQVDWNLSLARD